VYRSAAQDDSSDPPLRKREGDRASVRQDEPAPRERTFREEVLRQDLHALGGTAVTISVYEDLLVKYASDAVSSSRGSRGTSSISSPPSRFSPSSSKAGDRHWVLDNRFPDRRTQDNDIPSSTTGRVADPRRDRGV